MVHVVRRLLGAFLVLAIVAGATLALSSRPRLQSDRNAVERDWRTVQPGLSARYARVDALARSISEAGGPTNPLIGEVESTYASWKRLAADDPVAHSITLANTLEGFARRLDVLVTGSPLLTTNTTVSKAHQQMLDDATIPTGVTPLNDDIARYEKDRGGPVRRIVAGPLGFSAIPRLALATGA
jgi:hypothetical protein